MQVNNLSNRAKSFFNMIEFDQSEELVWEIRKHPFGLFVVYFTGTVITLIIFSTLVLSPIAINDELLGVAVNLGAVKPIMIGLGFLLTVFGLVGTVIGAYLYEANVVLVTSEKIAQLQYKNLFNRNISQLSIGDVQDVNVHQKGVLARMFNFGTLIIETAGEQNNYVFSYTPNPYEAAKAIVNAHEENLKRYGN
jgi:membrane protein YdbS with pleckstrin-like domain